MKRRIWHIVVIFILVLSRAEAAGVNFSAKMANAKITQQVLLNGSYKPGEKIEGYFYTTIMEGVIEGKLTPGGISFMEPRIFGFYDAGLGDKLAMAKYPIGDIDSLTYGLRIEKAITFMIEPDYANSDGDSLMLLFKYCVFSLKPENNKKLHDVDYNLSPHYQHIKVAANKMLSFDFIDKYFEGYKINFSFGNRLNKIDTPRLKTGEVLAKEILESCRKSSVKISEFAINGEFVTEKNPNGEFNFRFFTPPFENRIQCNELPAGNTLIKEAGGIDEKLPITIYQFRFSFPFHLYNKNKDEQYAGYKTRNEIFNSNYNIIIVPISIAADTLEADIFISYTKLQIDDVIRWTPSKKRIKMLLNTPVKIELPKENWSANFERGGEKYDIYGYSDYEKYADEYLILNFTSIK